MEYEVRDGMAIIPAGVKEIEEEAFAKREELRKVVIPKGVKRIGSLAFASCSNLQEVEFPEGMEIIESFAFEECVNLRKIKWSKTIKKIGEAAFMLCERLTEVEIPEPVKEIPDSVFIDCKELRTVKLSKDLKKIGDHAFSGCENLQDISFPRSLKEIGFMAFYECKSLNAIQLPRGLKAIEYGAFGECTAIKEVVLPLVTKKIAASAFEEDVILKDRKGRRRRLKEEKYDQKELEEMREELEELQISLHKMIQGLDSKQFLEKEKDPYERLKDMIGMDQIKSIIDQIIATREMAEMRKKAGIKESDTSMHMLFTGNPGTGKTSVARLIAQILKEKKVLSKGTYVECSRSDLVEKWVGHTAKKVKEVFEQAKGGVLFIDEAYALANWGDHTRNDFGQEAIDTIVQEMENMRGDILVIFAGYTENMNKFLDTNKGLRSRIAYHVNFPDYDEGQLEAIFEQMLLTKGFQASEKAQVYCKELFERVCQNEDYGNGRYVRNLVEQAVIKQAMRMKQQKDRGVKLTKQMVLTLEREDFEVNVSEGVKAKPKLGFA
ncbi:MAG: AAA family ATPase [Lachnospiraceae bacterium]|nr:AAA family ATPase [Lachnospiraceae bacterium]